MEDKIIATYRSKTIYVMIYERRKKIVRYLFDCKKKKEKIFN